MGRRATFAFAELKQPLWRIGMHTSHCPEEKRFSADIALTREAFLAMPAAFGANFERRACIVGDLTVAGRAAAYRVDLANEFRPIDCFAQARAYLERMHESDGAATCH